MKKRAIINVAGATALITGGSSGIGLAMAQQLAEMGAHIWLMARDPARLELACQQVSAARRDASQRVTILPADVADHEQVHCALAPLVAQQGAPEIVVNSAGVTYPGEFQHMDIDIFRHMMDVNYFGTLHVLKELAPGMMRRGSGMVINVSSAIGLHGIYGYSAYSPSKSAVIALSDALRYELGLHGIHVCVSLPTDTDTPQLAYEEKLKPPLLKAMVGTVTKPEPAEKVARITLREAFKGRNLIFPSMDGKLLYMIYRLFPGDSFYKLIDLLMVHARRELAKNNGHH